MSLNILFFFLTPSLIQVNPNITTVSIWINVYSILYLISLCLSWNLKPGPNFAPTITDGSISTRSLLGDIRRLWFAAFLAFAHTWLGPHRLGSTVGTSAECISGEVMAMWGSSMIFLVIQPRVPSCVNILITHTMWSPNSSVTWTVSCIKWWAWAINKEIHREGKNHIRFLDNEKVQFNYLAWLMASS